MATVERRLCKGACGKNKALRFFPRPNSRICRSCQRTKRAASTKDARLKESFNITMEQWQAILAMQGGKCAICLGKRPMYDTDHDHKLESSLQIEDTIRGLLCKRCNRRLLPASLDSVEILQRAIDYLKHGRERVQRIIHDSDSPTT